MLEVGKSLVPSGLSATRPLLSFRLLTITALALLWNSNGLQQLLLYLQLVRIVRWGQVPD